MGFPDDIEDLDDAMDLWGIFWFLFLAFIIMSCCGYCCSRKERGTVLSAPVVVTSATHTAPSGYTVTQMPVGATITTYQTQTYSAPYPTQGAPAQMPMPMPMPAGPPPPAGVHPYVAPYPTMPAASMNPPSYDAVVSGAGAGQPNNTIYEKQSAYNPNYPM